MNLFDRFALKTKNGLPYFENPELAKIGWVQHGFLTRKGGVSPPPYSSLNLSEDNGDLKEYVDQNKNSIAMAFCFDPRRLVLLNQIHQDRILLLRGPLSTIPSLLEYDALITNTPHISIGILTADCLPILIADQKKKIIAAIHVGRQGTALSITTKVLKKMKENLGCSSKDLIVTLGPSIGACCYEIDENVFLSEWESFSTYVGDGRRRVNLAKINIREMKKEGIQEEQIYKIDLCTSCHNDLFFSYRKERQTGRQLSFIGMR